MYSVKIIKDSVNQYHNRLTTFELCYPRFVHAELMTHRVFSRNSASSRALPTKKLLEQIRHNPVVPKWWGKNQSGMAAKEELQGWRKWAATRLWLLARFPAIWMAILTHWVGLHKQIANRVLEPWMYITVIVSATEWGNWYYLRDSEHAQPEIAWVAREMRRLHDESIPTPMYPGEWHLPYIDLDDRESPLFVSIDDLADEFLEPLGPNIEYGGAHPDIQDLLKKISTARCARVSYLTHAGKRDYSADIELHDKLSGNDHWSPFEHVAKAIPNCLPIGNFRGWFQYRKSFNNENKA